MTLKQNVLNGMLTGVGGFILKVVCNLLLIPLIIKFLGTEDYGFYIFLLGFAEILGILDIGISAGLTQRLSYYISLKDNGKLEEQLNLGHWLFIGVLILVILAGLPLSVGLGNLFHLSQGHQAIASAAFLIVFVDTALNLYSCFSQAVLKAHCRHQITNINEAGKAILGNLVSVALLVMGHGIIAILTGRLLVNLALNIWMQVQAVRLDSRCARPKGGVSLTGMKDLFSISLFTFFQRVNILIARQFDSILIGTFLTMVEVGIYGIVVRIFNYVTLLSWKIIDTIFPVFSRLSASENKQEARRLFLRISTLVVFVVTMLSASIMVNFAPIIRVLGSGKVSLDETLPLAYVVLPSILFSAAVAPAANYMFASGQHRFISKVSFVSSSINLLLSFVLVKSIGVLGPAVGTTVTQFVTSLFILVPYVCKTLGISWQVYVSQVCIRNLAPLTGSLLVLLAGQWFLSAGESLLVTMTLTVLSYAVGVTLWVILSATPEERGMLQTHLLKPLKQKLLHRGLLPRRPSMQLPEQNTP